MFKELARIFSSPLRVKLMKYFALQPDVRIAAKMIVPIVGATRPRVQAELVALTRAGILVSRSAREGVQYGWNRAYEHSGALQNFLTATTMPDDTLIAGFFRRLGATLVIVAGILADESRGAVDLLIVTRRPKDVRIAAAVKKLEAIAAIPIRFAVLGVEEYHDRLQAYDRMLRDILDFKHRAVVGRTVGR